MALGATFSVSSEGGVLLAGIIALQNLPEGFNSYRELTRSTDYGRVKIVGGFALMALLGPAFRGRGRFYAGVDWRDDVVRVRRRLTLWV